MPTQNKKVGSETRTVKVQRYWSRTDSPKPWHPWGTAYLVWIALLFVIGAVLVAPSIEADVRTQVSDRLHAAGIPSATVSANGQIASIRADAGETNETAVQTIAATTRCRTWAGQLPCPTTIDVTLDAPANVTTSLSSRPHAFTAVRSGSDVTLTGEVPNLVEQDRILDAAGRYFDVVANEMVITNHPATTNYTRVTNSAIAAVGHLQQGQAKWSDGSLSVIGFADAAGAEKSLEYFNSAGSQPMLGVFNVSAPSNQEGCNDKFKNVLAGAGIQFQTNSAMIDGSNQLLADLSRIAKTCPGQLVVGGHTDNRGSAEMNEVLSQARADSVLAALARLGVEPDRLIAIGYGEQTPIADNESAAGRATNRRISISTQSSN